MISKLELYVLGTINHKPSHGYELTKFFENIGLETITHISKPSIYNVLKRLEESGYLEGRYELDSDGPPKKVYSITQEGQQYFREQIRTFFFEYCPEAKEFWLVIRFIENNLTKNEFITLLKKKKKQIINHSEMMKEKKAKAIEDGIFNRLPFYLKPLSKMGKQIFELQKNTIDTLIKLANRPENSSTFIKED